MKKSKRQRHGNSGSIKAIDDFIAWTKKLDGTLFLYRGFADSAWGVEASGYRRIKNQEGDSPSPVFRNSIDRLLDNAGLQGFREKRGRELSDLELLADLQHNGAATCLIDFTTDPMVALWFACQENPEKNGKVIAMRTDNVGDFAEIEYKSLSNPIKEFFENGKLWKWSPRRQNNRIVAQNSVFVFGKGEIEERYYEAVEIKKDNKEVIIKELHDKFGINENYLFSDFAGYALANSHNKEYKLYSADDFLQLGIAFSQREDHEKAVEYYTKALGKDRHHAEAYCQRGNSKYALGDFKGAIGDYDEVLAINPEDADTYFYRGNAKSDLGRYRGAIVDYNKAIAIEPQFAHAYNNRGIAKHELGKYHDAIIDYDEALRIDSKLLEVYLNRGVSKSVLGDHDGAMADYNKAIKMNPEDDLAYYNRGVTKNMLGDQAGAKQDLSKAYELNPDLKSNGSD